MNVHAELLRRARFGAIDPGLVSVFSEVRGRAGVLSDRELRRVENALGLVLGIGFPDDPEGAMWFPVASDDLCLLAALPPLLPVLRRESGRLTTREFKRKQAREARVGERLVPAEIAGLAREVVSGVGIFGTARLSGRGLTLARHEVSLGIRAACAMGCLGVGDEETLPGYLMHALVRAERMAHLLREGPGPGDGPVSVEICAPEVRALVAMVVEEAAYQDDGALEGVRLLRALRVGIAR